jgi:hypothetical protein
VTTRANLEIERAVDLVFFRAENGCQIVGHDSICVLVPFFYSINHYFSTVY